MSIYYEKKPNDRVDAAGDDCVMGKLSIRDHLIPLASNDVRWRRSLIAQSFASLLHTRKLFQWIPVRWADQALAVPRYSLIDPRFAPLIIADSSIVIRYTKLKTTRRTDFTRSCTVRTGWLVQIRIAAYPRIAIEKKEKSRTP